MRGKEDAGRGGRGKKGGGRGRGTPEKEMRGREEVLKGNRTGWWRGQQQNQIN